MTYNVVIPFDHQPFFSTARSKHQARHAAPGRCFGLLEGRCRRINFCKSIHLFCSSVSKAIPERELKLPMMILDNLNERMVRDMKRDNPPDEECQDNDGS